MWAGPYCCRALAELGAEVIKIEGHKRLDITRRSVVWPLQDSVPTKVRPTQGLGYIAVNINKKSLTLDLNRPQGAQIARRLAAQSDMVMDKLGLGYEELKKVRRDIIVANLSSPGLWRPADELSGFWHDPPGGRWSGLHLRSR